MDYRKVADIAEMVKLDDHWVPQVRCGDWLPDVTWHRVEELFCHANLGVGTRFARPAQEQERQ